MPSFETPRSHAVAGLLPLLVVAASCESPAGRGAEESSGQMQSSETSSTAETDDDEASDEPAPEVIDSELREGLCRDRDPCHLEQRWEAGEDDEGWLLTVQKLRLSEAEERPENVSDDPLHLQWWLARGGEDGIQSRQLLADNEIHRGPAYNKYSVEVESNRFVYRSRRRAGAPRYFTDEYTLQLSPLRVLERYSLTEDLESGYETRLDVRNYTGRENWFEPTCGEDGKPAEALPQNKSDWYAYEILPQVEAPDSFRNGGWQKTSIESCAARVDSRGNQSAEETGHGFVIHGDSGSPDDAQFRTFFGSPTELFIEIEDDRWIRDESTKIFNDHVEMWMKSSLEGGRCIPRETKAGQLGVGLAGNVYIPSGEKARGAFEVETAHVASDGSVESGGPPEGSDAKRARMRIQFREKPARLTVVYSDSDDGSEQERMIATSDLDPGDAKTLGAAEEVNEAFGNCRVEDGRFGFESDQSFETDQPAVEIGIER